MKKILATIIMFVATISIFAQDISNKVLVAYFSNTGTTERLANTVAEILNADVFKIVPENSYTKEDLNWKNMKSRSSIEMLDENSRPKIASTTDISQYEKIIIAYPIWWGKAPRIIATFMESYDFTDKIIIPICTSGSSGFGKSDAQLKSIAKKANWGKGMRFSGKFTKEDVKKHFNSIK